MSEEEDILYLDIDDEEEEDSSDDILSDIEFEDEGESSYKTPIGETYNSFIKKYPVVCPRNGRYVFSIPSDFIPLGQRCVYGFAQSDILLNFTIDIINGSWTQPPIIKFEHPLYKDVFIGRPLIIDLIKRFFSPKYVPKAAYLSVSLLMDTQDEMGTIIKKELAKSGFSEENIQAALHICHGNVYAAQNFLQTGKMNDLEMPLPVEFDDCPLLYFVMEVCDVFLGLSNHCCFCGRKLKESTLKPSVCDNTLCNTSFTNLGVGTSLLQEIKRDPEVADLMISCFATALGTKWLTPAPEGITVKKAREIIDGLPRVYDMTMAPNDIELGKMLGKDAFMLLNWIILSNKSQLISLPPKLRLKQFPTRHQFLTLISNVEKEEKFRALKIKYGSMFLWHGSTGDRWHSIIRNGLKSATGTSMQQNGSFFGAGIYLAPDLSLSRKYSTPLDNLYKKSQLGTSLQAVGLCEVAKIPELIDHKVSFTTVKEDAVIVRFLFLSANFEYNVVENPPEHVPKLRDILNYIASENK